MSKHIVFGGDGFLGQEVIKKLKQLQNIKIIVVDIKNSSKQKYSFIKCDISKIDQLKNIPLEKDDVVHHLASKLIIPNKPRFNRFNYFESTTVTGTKNILSLMRENNCKNLIFWSTDMVYGNKGNFPISQEYRPAPLGDYGETKFLAEKLISNEIKNAGLRCTIFRPRLIIGTGRLGILKNLFFLAKHNLPIPTIGDATNYFQFVSVSDCANASLLAVKNGFPCEIYNLGSERPYTIKILLNSFLKKINSKSIVFPIPSIIILPILKFLSFLQISPMEKEQYLIADKNMFLSTSNAKKDLNWSAIDDDLEMLINAYKFYIKKLKK